MTNGRVCKKHIESPVIIYKQCVGCELEHLQQQLADRDKTIAEKDKRLSFHIDLNNALSEQVLEYKAEIERLRCKKSAKP